MRRKNVAVLPGSGAVCVVKSRIGSSDPDKTLTEFALSKLHAMARVKADKMGPCLMLAPVRDSFV